VLWNAFDPPIELRESFGAVYQRARPDSPLAGFWSRPAVDTYRIGGGRAADGMRQAGGFGEPEEWLADWARPYTRDEWLDLVPTLGGWGQFPGRAQAEILAGLGAAVDAAGGAFTMGYTTLAVTAARLAP
jgi:hypothetical protein